MYKNNIKEHDMEENINKYLSLLNFKELSIILPGLFGFWLHALFYDERLDILNFLRHIEKKSLNVEVNEIFPLGFLSKIDESLWLNFCSQYPF